MSPRLINVVERPPRGRKLLLHREVGTRREWRAMHWRIKVVFWILVTLAIVLHTVRIVGELVRR